MSEPDKGEDVKMTPVEKMRIRVASEGYKSLDDADNNNPPPTETDTLKNDVHKTRKSSSVVDDAEPRTCSTLEQILAFLLVIAVIVIVVLLTMTLMMGFGSNSQIQTCISTECVEISGSLLKNMDLTTDPCTDFYKYACGRFTQDALIPPDEKKYSWFSFISRIVKAQTKRLLDDKSTVYRGRNSSAIAKVKLYFHVCMNTTAYQTMGTSPLLKWLETLGSWTVDYDEKTGNWTVMTFNKEQSLAKLFSYEIRSLFSLSINMDEKNNSFNMLKFDQGGLTFRDYTNYLGNESSKYEDIYKEYYTTTVTLLGGSSIKAAEMASSLWDLETNLAMIMDRPESRVDIRELYHKMTLNKLQNILDETSKLFDLSEFLDHLFNKEVPSTEQVVVRSPSYFSKLGQVLKNTKDEVLANYMAWKAIQKVISYQSRKLQDAKSAMEAKIIGTSQHPLWFQCVTSTESVLPDAMGALYVDKFFTNEKKLQVDELAMKIVDTFKSRLPKVEWMDEVTLKNALEKVDALSYKIAYPEYIEKPENLDQAYEMLTVTNSTPFSNYLNALMFSANKTLDRLGKPPDRLEWGMAPTEVNAYYTPLLNQIVFPAAILNEPFYDLSYPMAMNYGSMGFIMGHELTHGFDNRGHTFDKYGNLKNWWTNSSSKHFNEKTECLVKQYNKYRVGNHHINGLTTLGENIADNGGLKTSYKAYQSWLKGHGYSEKEARLPGLNTTEKQLFFLSFAQTWCAYYTPEYAERSLVTDYHTYAKYRVMGTLSNIPQFSDAYSCAENSPMNPTHKCSVW